VSVEEAVREVAVIGATLDLGAGRRGVDMGPSAIRYAGLEQQLGEKVGVRVSDAGNVISPVAETAVMGDENSRYLDQILDLCDRLARMVADAAGRGAVDTVAGRRHPTDRHLDLVALATVADMVPLVGENRRLVREGLRLLRRSPRGVTLTAEGKLFLEEVRDLLKRADESVEKVRALARGEYGELHVGYSLANTGTW